MEYTTLTHPQFARALRLAYRHSHGWADQLYALCIQTAGVVRDRHDVSYDADRRARREDLLALATEEQRAALGRVEEAVLPPPRVALILAAGSSSYEVCQPADALRRLAAGEAQSVAEWRPEDLVRAPRSVDPRSGLGSALTHEQLVQRAAPRPEISVRDLAHVAWIGIGPDGDPGIVAPCLDFEGDVFHTTGSGRLEWLIDREGGVSLSVNRPGPTQHCITFDVVGRGLTGDQAQALLGDPEYLAGPYPLGEARLTAEGLAESLREGGHAVYLHPASGGTAPPDGAPVMMWLEIREAKRGSVTVLRATVSPSTSPHPGVGGDLRVSREESGTMHFRHVAVLNEALAALEVWWDPALELARAA